MFQALLYDIIDIEIDVTTRLGARDLSRCDLIYATYSP